MKAYIIWIILGCASVAFWLVLYHFAKMLLKEDR